MNERDVRTMLRDAAQPVVVPAGIPGSLLRGARRRQWRTAGLSLAVTCLAVVAAVAVATRPGARPVVPADCVESFRLVTTRPSGSFELQVALTGDRTFLSTRGGFAVVEGDGTILDEPLGRFGAVASILDMAPFGSDALAAGTIRFEAPAGERASGPPAATVWRLRRDGFSQDWSIDGAGLYSIATLGDAAWVAGARADGTPLLARRVGERDWRVVEPPSGSKGTFFHVAMLDAASVVVLAQNPADGGLGVTPSNELWAYDGAWRRLPDPPGAVARLVAADGGALWALAGESRRFGGKTWLARLGADGWSTVEIPRAGEIAVTGIAVHGGRAWLVGSWTDPTLPRSRRAYVAVLEAGAFRPVDLPDEHKKFGVTTDIDAGPAGIAISAGIGDGTPASEEVIVLAGECPVR